MRQRKKLKLFLTVILSALLKFSSYWFSHATSWLVRIISWHNALKPPLYLIHFMNINMHLYINSKWLFFNKNMNIERGITFNNTLCCMRGSARRWHIFENSKIFLSFAKYFWIFLWLKNTDSWLLYSDKFFMNHQIVFLDWENKAKLLLASFLKFSRKK